MADPAPVGQEGSGPAAPPAVGDRLVLDVGPVAPGGHCVARTDGLVVFVRHALPGERVVAAVTGIGGGGRFLRADAVEVLSASPDRVPVRCPVAGPGGCGGCDWQHATTEAQRRLKTDVLREQLHRLGGIPEGELGAVEVAVVAGDEDGLHWRTRVRWAVDDQGRAGLRAHREHRVVPIERCPLVNGAVDAAGVTRSRWPGVREVVVAAGGNGAVAVRPDPDPDGRASGPARLVEHAGGRTWRVAAGGFWQVHPGAAHALVAAVREVLVPAAGEHLLDLYAGVGLFAGALAGDLGPGGRVDAVESEAGAVRDARRNLHDLPTVRLHEAPVARWLARDAPRRCDLVVLDPPRTGAGPDVVRRLVRLRPRAVAYVACDPAALGRDVAAFRALGWRLVGVRGLDLFPLTHHLEAVAHLVPA